MKRYKTEYCDECKCEIVICPKCKNTCHYGSIGKVPILSKWFYDEENDEYFYEMEDCDECLLAYEYQRQIAPELSDYYAKVYLNSMEIGNTNSNHCSFDESNEKQLYQEPATITGTFLECRDLYKLKELI